MVCKIGARLLDVARDSFLQRCEIRKLRFVAQLPEKTYSQAAAVEIAVSPVKQVYFQQWQRHGIDRGTKPEARHTVAQSLDFHDENSRERGRMAKLDVRGGESQPPAELRSVPNPPRDH